MPTAVRGALATPGTRILLIGTGHYSGPSDLPDLPSVRTTVTALRDSLTEHCGAGADTLGEPLLDPATPADIGHALVRCAESATDVLLVYYGGHGLIGGDSQLYLAASQTVSQSASLGFSAFPYQQLRESLAGCRARVVAVILDCCFAGRAAEPAEGMLASLTAPGATAGSYLLASAAYGEAALAPRGEPHTAFGGALIRLIADGVPAGPRLLTLTEVYKALDRTLSAQGRPRPRCRSSGSAGDLVLTVNPGYQPPRFPLPPGEPAGEDSAPYLGLAPYGEADARLFFGREELLAKLRRELAGQLAVPGPLVLLGPSGAGKSSLLRAGLRPSLDAGLPGAAAVRSWPKVVFTPGSDPAGALASQLSGVLAADPGVLRARLGDVGGLAALAREAVRRHARAGEAGPRRLVLIADQFEEIFGPEVRPERRDAFLAALSAATGQPGDGTPPAVLAIVGLRADFYGRALSEPFLADALARKRTFDVTPMTGAELRDVITRPATAAGLAVEPELADRILDDLRAEDLGAGPGLDTRLPLLSEALLATWRNRQGATLTLRGYQAAGGLSGAAAHSAAQLWAASADGQPRPGSGQRPLTGEEREIARRLLLQLVSVGSAGTEVTRRRVPLAELAEALGAGSGEPGRTQSVSYVLARLISARLVTVDRDHAEIIHDALLRTWPRLREWIDADRVNLAVGRQVSEAAAEWDRLGRHRGDLYAGSRLEIARQWATATGQLPGLVADFLRQSVRAARARRRRFAAGLAALGTALALSAALLVVSVNDARNLRASNKTLASERIAAIADTVRGSDPELARDLALAAYHLAPTSQAAQSLAQVSVTPAATEIRAGGGGTPNLVDVAFSPGGGLLAAANGKKGIITLWKNAESSRPALAGTIRFPRHCVLAFAPGTEVLAASCGGVTTLLDVARPSRPARIAAFGAAGQRAETIAISPDRHWLVTGAHHGLVQLWDIADRAHPRLAGSAQLAAPVTSAAFSADSRVLAVVAGFRARVTALRSSAPLAHLSSVPGADGIFAVAFSPRGRELAAANPGGPPLLYNTADLAHIRALPVPPWAQDAPDQTAISFTRDGRAIALGLADGGVELGPARAGSQNVQAYTLPSPGITEAMDLSPGGHYLAGAGSDGIVRVWDVARHPVDGLTPMNFADQLGISPDGKLLVIPGSGGGPQVWDISDPARPVLDHVLPSVFWSASFAPDGRTLMTMQQGGHAIALWNLADPRAPVLDAQLPEKAGGYGYADASPFGPLLAISDSVTASVTVWDIRHPGNPVRRATITSRQLSSSGLSPFLPIFLSSTTIGTVNSQDTRLLRWDLSRKGTAVPLSPLPALGGFAGLSDDISSGCRTLVTASSGHRLQLWNMANPRTPSAGRQVDMPTATLPLTSGEPLAVTDSCLLAEAANAGTTTAVKVWDVRNPRSPHLIATLPTTGTISDIEVSDDGSRIAAIVQPPENTATGTQALDVWSVHRRGASRLLAALPVSKNMAYSEFVPRTHLILFAPATASAVLPDILNPDPAASYRSLCATTQRVLSPSTWSRYVPGIPYEPPC